VGTQPGEAKLMYTFLNVFIHVVFIAALVYAMLPDKPQAAVDYNDLSLKQMILVAALGMVAIWSVLVGVVANVRNILTLF
jgi:hypothetical protein